MTRSNDNAFSFSRRDTLIVVAVLMLGTVVISLSRGYFESPPSAQLDNSASHAAPSIPHSPFDSPMAIHFENDKEHASESWMDAHGNTYTWPLHPSKSSAIRWRGQINKNEDGDNSEETRQSYKDHVPLVFCNVDQGEPMPSSFAAAKHLDSFDKPLRAANIRKLSLLRRSTRMETGQRSDSCAKVVRNASDVAEDDVMWSGYQWRQHAIWQQRHSTTVLQDVLYQDDQAVENLRAALGMQDTKKDILAAPSQYGLTWPYSSVWPLPSVVTAGKQHMPSSKVISSFVSNDKAGLPSGNPFSSINASCAGSTFPRVNIPAWGWFGLHANETFSTSKTAQSYVPWISPLLTIFLDSDAATSMPQAELQTLYSAATDLCIDISLNAYTSKFSDFVRESYVQTNGFSDLFDERKFDAQTHARKAANYDECDRFSSDWMSSVDYKKERAGKSVHFPDALLSSIVINMHGKNSVVHPLSEQCMDASAHVDGVIDALNEILPRDVFEKLRQVPMRDICHNYLNVSIPTAKTDMNERYTLALEASADGHLSVMTATVMAASVWGVLRGLQSTQQLSQGFGTLSLIQTNTYGEELGLPRLQLPVSDLQPQYPDGSAPRCNASVPLLAALPVFVADSPAKAWRGFSLDTSRHFIPVDKILQLLDAMKVTKLNVLHWHLADAQSFPIELYSLPEISEKGRWDANKTYSYADIKLIVMYASVRGIRVMPEVDAPAHARALSLAAPPDVLVHCDAVAGANLHDYDKYALNPSSDNAFAWYSTILAELSMLFPDSHVHIGADEVAAACWDSDRKLIEWAQEKLPNLMAALEDAWTSHSKQYTALLAYWLHRVHRVAAVLGKTVVAWEDSHAMLANIMRSSGGSGEDWNRYSLDAHFKPTDSILAYAFPVSTVIQGWKCWEQHADGAVANAAKDWVALDETQGKQRRRVLNSACWYLDYSVPWTDIYRHWSNPESSGHFADIVNKDYDSACLQELKPLFEGAYTMPLEMALETYAGGEAAMWTERVDGMNLECRAWPRAAAVAEVLWSESAAVWRVTAAKRLTAEKRERLLQQAATAPSVEGNSAQQARRLMVPRGSARSERIGKHQQQQLLAAASTSKFRQLASLQWVGRITDLNANKEMLEFASYRMLRVVRSLWRYNIAASPLIVYDLPKTTALVEEYIHTQRVNVSRGHRGVLAPIVLDDSATYPSNGWCPGIEQEIQRPNTRFVAGRAEPEHLQFIVWNVDKGGENDRITGITEFLRKSNADVVAVVEATGWTHRAGGRRASVEQQQHQHDDDTTSMTHRQLEGGSSNAADPEPWKYQTMDLRRRAAAAGYPFAYLLHSPSGYHLVLMSVRPITVVLEDTAHFSRGLLVADTGGFRFMITHLHAQDARIRMEEAAWMAFLAEEYSQSGVPVVLAGDFNTLSPLDAACHNITGLKAFLKDTRTPDYLKNKFLTPKGELDYCPFWAALGAPVSELHDGCAAVNAPFRLVDATSQNNTRGIACAGTIPTRFQTDPLPEGLVMPAIDIDHVLLNKPAVQVFEASHIPTSCVIHNNPDVEMLSDHFPLVCNFRQPD